jgi:hypothetical protein
VVGAWQRALAQHGLTAGKFYRIYSPEAALPIADEALRRRFEGKRDKDLAEIYGRMAQVRVERSYRIVGELEKMAREIEGAFVPRIRGLCDRGGGRRSGSTPCFPGWPWPCAWGRTSWPGFRRGSGCAWVAVLDIRGLVALHPVRDPGRGRGGVRPRQVPGPGRRPGPPGERPRKSARGLSRGPGTGV